MKYYVFSFALLGVIPLALLLFLNSRWMRFALWGMALAMFAWQGTAINFLSHEEYRGSARGMEVSLLYLLSFALLLALRYLRLVLCSLSSLFLYLFRWDHESCFCLCIAPFAEQYSYSVAQSLR